MSIELMQTLSMVSYILAGVMLLVAIALFFLLGIKKVIGDVTGATARKAIENIRQQNEASGDKAYKPSPVNAARGRLTDKISESGRLQPRDESYGGSTATTKLDTTELTIEAKRLMEEGGSSETTVLSGGSETTVLSGMGEGSGETTVLSAEKLTPSSSSEGKKNETADENFKVDVEMGFTGTSETIE